MTKKNLIFFIIGCQRSGTTLARLVLESHSKITCIDEPFSYQEMVKPSKNFSNKYFGFKAPLITEQFNEPFFSDVSLNFIIPNKFKQYPRIFIIRDVRDTIASMQNLKQNSTTWYNIWPERSLKFWKYTIPDFDKIYRDDLQKISNSKDKLISTASFYWKYKNLSYLNYEQNGSQTCKIKYEDFVTKPKKTLQKIVNFLNLEWEEDLLLHHKKNHNFTDKNGMTVGNTNTKLSIQNFVGKYKNNFTDVQLDEIMTISGDLMKKLEYE